jgi:hypothetical protein
MPDPLEFKITASAELTALQELERQLIRDVTAAKVLGKSDDVKKFGDQLVGVQSRLGEFSPGQKIAAEVQGLAGRVPVLGTAMDALGGKLGPVAAGLTAVSAGLAAGSKAVREFANFETDVVKLNQALANSGQYSEESSAQVQELANKYKALTDIDDSKFIDVSTTLLKFGAKTDDLDRYTEAVVNLAGIMGGDLTGASNLFAKALAGNFDTLSRYGLQVEKAGTQQQKLDSIMRQAAERGAGQLTAGSETLNRKFSALRLGVDDMVKGFGNLIARTGVVQFGLDALRGGVDLLNRLLPSTVKATEDFTNRLGGVGETAEETARKLDAATKSGEDLGAVSLARLTEQAAAADRAFAALTAQIRATEQAQIALTDAKLARDLALIDEDEKSGQLTASRAAEARFATKQAAEDEKTRLQLASIAAQKQEQQQRVAIANADVSRRQEQIGSLSSQGAQATDTAAQARRGLSDNQLARQSDIARRDEEIAALREKIGQTPTGTAEGRRTLKELSDQIAAKQAEGKAADESFAAAQQLLRARLDAATAEAARIQAEIDKLKPELEKAKANAEVVRKDANATTAQLDIQDSSIRAIAPIKQETADIQDADAQRQAAEKDRQQQQADDAAAVERGLLGNAGTSTQAAEPGVRKVGTFAKATGNTPLFEAAKKAQEAIDATRDGTTSEEAKAALDALQGLTEALKAGNRRSAALEQIVKDLAAGVNALKTQQANNRALD